MPYKDNFIFADDLISQLNPIIKNLNNPYIETKFTGFLIVSSVTVLEMALKNIFIDFAKMKHIILGNFCDVYFNKIHGKIRLEDIKGDYLNKFGKIYKNDFISKLETLQENELLTNRISITDSYTNLITWRNDFVHQFKISNATFQDTIFAYECGKKIMDCLSDCLQ